jgi:hypothetical protein
MTAAPFTIEPYPGREGRSGDKIQVIARASDFKLRRAPEVEGYECFFVSYFGTKGIIKFSYRKKSA